MALLLSEKVEMKGKNLCNSTLPIDSRAMRLATSLLAVLIWPSRGIGLNDMRIYGLMVTRSDYWTMHTWLAVHAWQFESLVVLDGTVSTDLASRIEAATMNYDNVIYAHEKDLEVHRPITDNTLRGVAWSLFPNATDLLGAWIVVAHPDEFYLQRFSDLAHKAEGDGANALSMKILYALPFIKDRHHLEEGVRAAYQRFNILYRVRYCTSDYEFWENRMYKFDSLDIHWGNRHSYTWPEHFPGLKRAAWSGWYVHYKVHNFDDDAVASDGRLAHSSWSDIGSSSNIYSSLDDDHAKECAEMVSEVCTSVEPPCRMFVI